MTEKKEIKKDKTVKKQDNDKISLSTFKTVNNIPKLEYAVLKAVLKAEDADLFKKTDLEREYKKALSKPVFV
jgi:hypothetical protein